MYVVALETFISFLTSNVTDNIFINYFNNLSAVYWPRNWFSITKEGKWISRAARIRFRVSSGNCITSAAWSVAAAATTATQGRKHSSFDVNKRRRHVAWIQQKQLHCLHEITAADSKTPARTTLSPSQQQKLVRHFLSCNTKEEILAFKYNLTNEAWSLLLKTGWQNQWTTVNINGRTLSAIFEMSVWLVCYWGITCTWEELNKLTSSIGQDVFLGRNVMFQFVLRKRLDRISERLLLLLLLQVWEKQNKITTWNLARNH